MKETRKYAAIWENNKADLFDETDYEKLARMDKAVDDIRKRFGIDAFMRATFLNQPIDHMCGGISREKEKWIMIK